MRRRSKSKVRFARTSVETWYAYDAAGPVWGIIDRISETEFGQCWKRDGGRAGYYGAWAFKIRGQGVKWSDSRASCGSEALRDWLRKIDAESCS